MPDMGAIQTTKKYLRDCAAVAATDLSLLRSRPRLMLAAFALALVPSIYALIYLSSVWDPNAKTSRLPVALVNLDQGYEYKGRNHNVGEELIQTLMETGEFGYRRMTDGDAARAGVRLGRLAFAVIIPSDFSAQALPGERAGSGSVIVVLSEGNNYASAGLARRFASELGHRVNEALNEQRWEQVLLSADGSGKSLEMLRSGMAQLRTGMQGYQAGHGRYSATAAQLAAGLRQVGHGLRTMDDQMPSESDLRALKHATQRLAQRQREFGAGLEQLHAGSRRLVAGTEKLQEELAGIPFVGERFAEGAGELGVGGRQLSDGLATAMEAQAQLSRGAARIEEGTTRLVEGATSAGEGVRTMAARVPEDARLDAFNAAGADLTRALARLRTGIELVEAALPVPPGRPDGSARGLADSVEPVLEVQAPVSNNGSAFAPNMVAMALWLGAIMALHLFNLGLLSDQHAEVAPLARSVGRYVAPALIVLAQTLLVFLALRLVLGVSVPGYASFTLVLLTTGQAFLAIVFLLLRGLGEAGKLVVVLLLTLQLAAGGGVMPIELTADVFQSVHDWLPFSWAVRALRASLFGAFEGDWLRPWLALALVGGMALLLSGVIRRWRIVPRRDYAPAVDL